MMNPTERRRALNNAIEQLMREGSVIVSRSRVTTAMPVITIELPPIWMMLKSSPMVERINGMRVESQVYKFCGCLVRWVTREMPETYQLTQNLNPYSPEQIAQWPVNL